MAALFLLLPLLMAVMLAFSTAGASVHQNDTKFDSLFDMLQRGEDYNYENDEEPHNASDTREIILISYLGAVSQLSKNLIETLKNVAETKSKELQNDIDVHSKCFRTDFSGSVISGALQVAIDDINSSPLLLPNHKLAYIFNNTCGDERRSTEFFMDHWRRGAKVFIGPEMNCRTEATMAAAQNLPIISHKCKEQQVSNKLRYPTFARTVPAETKIVKSLMALLRHYEWRKFTIIYENHPANAELFNAIKSIIEGENERMDPLLSADRRYTILNTSLVAYPFSEVGNSSDVEQIIADTSPTTRIYLTFGNVVLFRRILLVMGELGLMEKGEYVLLYLNVDYNWLNVYHAMNNNFFRDTRNELLKSWDTLDSPDRKVVNYSRTALAIIPTPVRLDTPQFEEFWRRASHYLPRFGVSPLSHLTLASASVSASTETASGGPAANASSIKANRFSCYLYDAVMLYATALHEVMAEGNVTAEEAINNGTAIISKILGRKYASMQGFDMQIDEHGDAMGNYTLLSLQEVEPVFNRSSNDYYPLNVALTPSADFIASSLSTIDADEDSLPHLRFQRHIDWPNGKPPLDEPACGFFGERCRQNGQIKYGVISVAMVVGIALVLGASAFLTYRNRKFERELSMIWRIDQREIEKIVQCNASTNSLYVVETSALQVSAYSEDVHCSATAAATTASYASSQYAHPQKPIQQQDKRWSGLRGVALYKGSIVAIKELRHRKPKELTRSTKIEMKAMRQLHHSNLNSFLGIIVFPSSICVVREYSPKSSLMDILRNHEIKLDTLFIASFVEDAIKGMSYLHESELKVHGNLKSPNCLITSRWALQVADYGLSALRDGQEWDSPQLMWESYLWTSPEHLRESELVHAVRGTQKGDVYSFGIILHEMLTRQGPFGLIEEHHSTAEEVVRRVASGDGYRPRLDILECQDYLLGTLTSCWAESPEHRPDFRAIRHRLKPLFSGIYKSNLMDHCVMMMEKYQTQLEDLVEERTAELREEKRRTEGLLQRMLPISVAQQLLTGKDVVPELFPSVTIYFSDIVGFTSLSSTSSPMEVVRFLNKLYTLFDSIIRRYEVYKVETIGDAYMVVAGVPTNTCERVHAEQIGMMALHLLTAVENFRIPHRPDEQLKLRVGIHTGPAVAGVVGKTMPRYCLFGDTVNTASRMESTSKPLRIHCSEQTRNVLAKDFVVEERGHIQIKGKGLMRTYWLLEREGYEFEHSFEDNLSSEEAADFSMNDIFPRTSAAARGPTTNNRISSTWTINRASCISLQREGPNATSLLKRLVEKATSRAPRTVEVGTQNNQFGFASVEQPLLVSYNASPSAAEIKRGRKQQLFASRCIPSTDLGTAASIDQLSSTSRQSIIDSSISLNHPPQQLEKPSSSPDKQPPLGAQGPSSSSTSEGASTPTPSDPDASPFGSRADSSLLGATNSSIATNSANRMHRKRSSSLPEVDAFGCGGGGGYFARHPNHPPHPIATAAKMKQPISTAPVSTVCSPNMVHRKHAIASYYANAEHLQRALMATTVMEEGKGVIEGEEEPAPRKRSISFGEGTYIRPTMTSRAVAMEPGMGGKGAVHASASCGGGPRPISERFGQSPPSPSPLTFAQARRRSSRPRGSWMNPMAKRPFGGHPSLRHRSPGAASFRRIWRRLTTAPGLGGEELLLLQETSTTTGGSGAPPPAASSSSIPMNT